MSIESKFLTPLLVQPLDDGIWEVMEPLVYQSQLLFDAGLKHIITVRKGFVTDLASVPRVPIFYVLFGNRAHHESVPHDWIYQTHCYPKSIADSLFKEMMIIRKKPFYIYHPMYMGVLLGGYRSYLNGPTRFQILGNDERKPAI